MSDIDLTEALTATARIIGRRWNMSIRNPDVMSDAEAVLAAVAPLIEQAIREQIAQRVKNEAVRLSGLLPDDVVHTWLPGIADAFVAEVRR